MQHELEYAKALYLMNRKGVGPLSDLYPIDPESLNGVHPSQHRSPSLFPAGVYLCFLCLFIMIAAVAMT